MSDRTEGIGRNRPIRRLLVVKNTFRPRCRRNFRVCAGRPPLFRRRQERGDLEAKSYNNHLAGREFREQRPEPLLPRFIDLREHRFREETLR